MKVELYGTDNHTIEINAIAKTQAAHKKPAEENQERSKNTDPAAIQHRRASFACLREITPKMAHKVSQNDIWDYIKDFHNVISRSHLSTREWAITSAILNNAHRNPMELKRLVQEVLEHKEKKQRTPDENQHQM